MLRIITILITVSALLPAATIAEKTVGLTKMDGFLPLYWDAKNGKMFLEFAKPDEEFLYYSSLPAGLGSNDVGLDRGQVGRSHVLRLERNGPKLLLVEQNDRFRAESGSAAEKLAVEQSFAKSAIWGFTVEAESDGHLLVDATNFFLRDAHGAVETLKAAKQGTYRVDPSRSMFYQERTKVFPRNTEVEVTLTLTGDGLGSFVRSVAPSTEAITLREHHSLVALPETKYKPRRHDPRAGYFGLSYMDYSTPFTEPITQRLITRHRLEKRDPNAAVSEPVKPIVYYLDNATPEPIRSALLDGARWWGQAFEAAGFRNAFQVEILPDGADPMDARYNMIQWVHRSTRGWSYGASVIDPRTGEILKGHVTLGSLRVRQDYLIAEALLAPYDGNQQVSTAGREMALARLRQLSAHEVGHTLGLAHNFAASAKNRASVMDYPHPLIGLPETGAPDLADAYAVGIGEWDKVAIAYGYSQFAGGVTEANPLGLLLRGATDRGLEFISDEDARAEGGAHPRAHLWDSGGNAVDELDRIMKIRERALARFGVNNIRPGAAMSTLGDTLVPLYLLHRYQTEAAAKVLGGVHYSFALRSDGQTVAKIVPAAEQARALEALLRTLDAKALTLSEQLLGLLPPRAMGYAATREQFRGNAGLTFDSLAPAEAAANHTVGMILHPQRAHRLVEQHGRDSKIAGLEQVVDRLLNVTWKASRLNGLQGEVQQTVEQVVVYHLMALAAGEGNSGAVRAIASLKLQQLSDYAKRLGGPRLAQARFAVLQIERFLKDPQVPTVAKPVEAPPGQPIGCEDFGQGWTGDAPALFD